MSSLKANGGNHVRVGVLGASGYTGGELLRLLAGHERMSVELLTAERRAGLPLDTVFPHLGGLDAPPLIKIGDADWERLDAVFCCLPHGATQETIAALPTHLKVVDLSADFRLRDTAEYARYYGHPHRAEALQAEAVYGLTEHARDDVKACRLVANPGCYPTVSLLPLLPLAARGLIAVDDVIIDAKSGVSGAGREAKEASLFAEVSEGIHAYGIAKHRHAPEIEQALSAAAGHRVTLNFTPHLMPMNRGILATTYVRLEGGADVAALRAALEETYGADEPFVRVLPDGVAPATRHVRGSNHCLIGVFADRIPGRAILVSAIDNLVKGASGQAIQNMNLMVGIPETSALTQAPLFP